MQTDHWRKLDTGNKAIRKDAVKMVEATGGYNGGDITKESEEMQNRGVEEA